jgi:hypothetical protein
VRPPDIAGRSTNAWRLTPTAETAKPSGLDSWLIHDPGIHAFWSWWIVSGCSLRDIPGAPPAKLQRPDMSHEILILALNPEKPPIDPDLPVGLGGQRVHHLEPLDLVCQVGGITDEDANRLIMLLCRVFCDGLSHPDADFRVVNEQMVIGTAAHFAAGMHQAS